MLKWRKVVEEEFGEYECEGFKIYRGIKAKTWFLIKPSGMTAGEFPRLKDAKEYAEQLIKKEVQ